MTKWIWGQGIKMEVTHSPFVALDSTAFSRTVSCEINSVIYIGRAPQIDCIWCSHSCDQMQ